jgi:hypothetical protein
MTEHPTPDQILEHIEWICDVCEEPITDDAGYLHVDHHEVGQVERAWRAYDEHERRRQKQGGRYVLNLAPFEQETLL